ncbi:MAG: hypothetical protein V4596_13500 [Bdellovibrionota bacterium]
MSETNNQSGNNQKKPILDQVREAIQNKDQIKQQVVQNLQTAGKLVEVQARELLKQTKQSKFFNDNIVPFAGSELADKAIDVLNTRLKLKDTTLMKNVEKLRKDILDTKVKKAKVAKEAPATTEEQ